MTIRKALSILFTKRYKEHLKQIADAIREERGRKCWTQTDLAQAAGLSLTQINNIESGNFGTKVETIHKIASALDVPVNKILKMKNNS